MKNRLKAKRKNAKVSNRNTQSKEKRRAPLIPKRNEYFPDFIDRVGPVLEGFNDIQIKTFITTYWPEITFPEIGQYVIENPFSGRVTIVNHIQAAVCQFILNGPTFSDFILHGITTTRMQQEKFDGARYLVQNLWPDLYSEQID